MPPAQGIRGQMLRGLVRGQIPALASQAPACSPIKNPFPLVRALSEHSLVRVLLPRNNPCAVWGKPWLESRALGSNPASAYLCCMILREALAHSVLPHLQAGMVIPVALGLLPQWWSKYSGKWDLKENVRH